MEFNTTEYQWSHGKMPRGRGFWVFFVTVPGKAAEDFTHNGSFAEAKAACRAKYRGTGATVKVGP